VACGRPQGRHADLGIKAKLDLVGEMVQLRVVWPNSQEAHGPLWVFADRHRVPSIDGGDRTATWAAHLHGAMYDWLRDCVAGKPARHPGQVVYVEASSAGANRATVARKRM
jgi:hypothetical protein